jgi:hypothetical protein
MHADQNQSSSGQVQSSASLDIQARIMAHQSESPTTRHFKLGQAIAHMYIAAQGVDIMASNAACEAMENATDSCRRGFDLIMKTSPYNVTALSPDQG